MSSSHGKSKPDDFSLMLGGPLYQLFLRVRMLRPPLDLLRRRVIVIALVAWLPLLILSILQGQFVGGAGVPFLLDIEVHARFLLALPLLIAAELVVHERLAIAVRQFLDREIVRKADRPRFDEILASTMRWRNSVRMEIFLIAFVFVAGHALWSQVLILPAETWYARHTDSGLALSHAGQWYSWVSLPVFQFILVRWYYRLILWLGFLWRVSRLDLDFVPSHPDHVGGLGFLGTGAAAFGTLVVAQNVVLSGMIASRIFHGGAQLQSFQLEMVGGIVFALLQVLAPLLVFVPDLLAAKRRGLREYGLLANRYVREFDGKWLRGGASPNEPLVGSADVQSLADLGNSYDVVRRMKPVPFGNEVVVQIAVIAALPFLPLVLTVIPLKDLIKRLMGVLF